MFNEIKETNGMKLLTIFAALLAAFAVGGGLALAMGSGGSSSGIDLTGSTTEIGTTTGHDAGEISGPCDEAEHANDPRCAGVTVPGADDDNRDDDGPGDISGPCDEAEHANDPRCTGAGPVDSSGPGHGGRDDDDDRSGPSGEDNSGPSDNSGPGSGGDDDDHDDDNSGPGSGSGSGSSGSG